MNNAIEIRDLKKTYPAQGKSPEKVALKGVSLDIPRGSMFALLGPNGAGKSTIINIMAGLVMKSEGVVNIWGTDIDENPRQSRANIGIVPQEIVMDPFFSPARALEIQAGFYGIAPKDRKTAEILEMVGLSDKANSHMRSLSGGMKRRLMVAKAMVHMPPILVLDEPTAGVDIELRRQLWANVKELNAQGMTILLTTHYLEEAQELCDKIAIINHGEVVACEDTETLLGRINNKEITFRLDREFDDVPEALKAFGAVKEGKRRVKILFSPEETEVGQMIDAIQKSGFGISDISTEDSDLEDVFLQITRS